MKIVRYLRDGGAAYGMLADGTIYGLAVSPFDPAFDAAAPALDGTQAPLSETELLTPCVPTKYLGVGLNFTGAAKAVGAPSPPTRSPSSSRPARSLPRASRFRFPFLTTANISTRASWPS